MRLPGQISAAIDILEDMQARHKPAALALKDWAQAHRFAGSGDRAVIGNIVYDALRRRASASSAMDSNEPRGIVLATMRNVWELPVEDITELAKEQFGPGSLSPQEISALGNAPSNDAPDWVTGDYPEWLHGSLQSVFGDDVAKEGHALAERAPVDLRVNTLKATRDKVLAALRKFGAEASTLSPAGIRIAAPSQRGRIPNVETEPAHGKGWFEVQDTASQIAAYLTGAGPGSQVIDLCAGAGGKTLALAAMMENKGQIHAYDADRNRLRAIFPRLQRSGVRNVQVIAAGDHEKLSALSQKAEVVLVDAPCSGSGTWRRNPDSKWRLTPQALSKRMEEQRSLLERAVGLVRPGGRIVYVTCSVLPEENTKQIETFLSAQSQFSLKPFAQIWQSTVGGDAPASADGRNDTLLMTPRRHGTDGFFVAVLERHN